MTTQKKRNWKFNTPETAANNKDFSEVYIVLYCIIHYGK